jgi:acetyl-CoA carboxylase biotin carboxyl carrier protein
MDRERVLKLVQMLKASQASELEIEREGYRVCITRRVPSSTEKAQHEGAESERQPNEPMEALVEAVLVNSHVVGFFRRGKEPGGEPLVEPGAKVTAGQPICAVEALRRWVLVEAPVDAEVVEFLLQDGERAEYGTALVRLRPVSSG